MSDFFPVFITILAMLIMTFLRFSSSIEVLLLHYASAKRNQEHVQKMTLFYQIGVISGTAILVLLAVLLVSLIANACGPKKATLFFSIFGIIFGILDGILAIFYFRNEKGTKHRYISRELSTVMSSFSRSVKNGWQAFGLGFKASLLEAEFSLPVIMLILAHAILGDNPGLLWRETLLILIFNLAPLMEVSLRYALGQNLADIQKKREKQKNLVRFLLSFCYFCMAMISLLALGVNLS